MKPTHLMKQILWGKSFKKTLLRLILFTVPVTYILAKWLLLPTYIEGISMEPTISDGKWIVVCTLKKPIAYNSIVCIRMSGNGVGYLKRIVGLPGDRIAFKEGKLFRNGTAISEPYLKYSCDWEMEERLVEEGKIYVVGDNRSMLIEKHIHGLTDITRILGSPLFY
ncbi:MAG: signal peptidase I [Planctomycetota bacterium]